MSPRQDRVYEVNQIMTPLTIASITLLQIIQKCTQEHQQNHKNSGHPGVQIHELAIIVNYYVYPTPYEYMYWCGKTNTTTRPLKLNVFFKIQRSLQQSKPHHRVIIIIKFSKKTK